MMRKFTFLAAVLMVYGCAGDENVPFIPQQSFANLPPIALNVSNIQVVDEYVPPRELPHVEHAAPTPPYRAIRLWADQRLRAAGQAGFVRGGIRDASIVQKPVMGQVEYDGRIDVELEADSGDGQHTAVASITVERQVTTDMDKDLAEKERVWDQLTHTMMDEFNTRAQNAIASNFGYFTQRGTP